MFSLLFFLIFFLPALGFTVLGGAFVVIGFRSRRAGKRFARTAARAPGQVTELRWRSFGPPGNGSSMMAHPVLRFETPDGRTVEVESATGNQPPPAPGQQVIVLYDPSDPTRAKIPDNSLSSVMQVVFMVIGTIVLVAGVAALVGIAAVAGAG